MDARGGGSRKKREKKKRKSDLLEVESFLSEGGQRTSKLRGPFGTNFSEGGRRGPW